LSRSPEPVREPLTTLDDWLRWLEILHPKKIDMSLDRVETVLAALELSPPPYRILSVAGTNGKGSCVATLERIYRQFGYRVGAYTSPHLWRFNERIRLDGTDAPDDDLVAVFQRIDRARGDTTLSYFEYTTVAAFLYFAERGVDLAVLEVGLGGRLDAVNAMDADLALIASIDLDHQHWLGETREAIGVEKAGIMRAGRPAVVADRCPPQALLDHAQGLGAQLKLIGRDFDLTRHGDGSWDYHGARMHLRRLPKPALRGAVQYGNTAACLAAIEALDPRVADKHEALALALAGVVLPGRLQSILSDGVEWLFDVAHNPAAARVLAAELEAKPVQGRTLAIVGMMADKDIGGVLEPMAGLVDEWTVTRADSERASDSAAIARLLESLGCERLHEALDVTAACELARRHARPGDRVVTFGSFYVVGPAMSALGLYCSPSLSD
jgi:dihydrofolate synthase/folylpolyglutamate synthase